MYLSQKEVKLARKVKQIRVDVAFLPDNWNVKRWVFTVVRPPPSVSGGYVIGFCPSSGGSMHKWACDDESDVLDEVMEGHLVANITGFLDKGNRVFYAGRVVPEEVTKADGVDTKKEGD